MKYRGYEAHLKDIVDALKINIPDYRETDSNPAQMLARIMAFKSDELELKSLQRENDSFIETSTLWALDNLVKFAGIKRMNAEKAIGEVTFSNTGIADVIIPIGTLISSDSGVNYQTVNSTPITLKGNSTIDVQIRCVEYGENGNTGPNTIRSLINYIQYVTINNSAAITNGRDIETDPELRARYFKALSELGKSTMSAMEAALLAVSDVSKIKIYENVTDVIDSKGLPPHSFRSYVEGGINQDIAEAIYNTGPLGIQTDGNISIGISGLNIKFSRPTQKLLDVNIVIETQSSVTAFKELHDESLKACYKAYINNFEIGQKVSIGKLYGELYRVTSDIMDIDITMGLTGNLSANDFILAYDEIAVPNNINITVSQVS